MPKTMTAPARLSLLLRWLNGDFDEHFYEGRNPEPVAMRTDYEAIRRVLEEFVGSFDGSTGAGHFEVVDDPNPPYVRQTFEPPTEEELDNLEAGLHILLEQGFDGPAGGETVKINGGEITTLPRTFFLPASSLQFAVRSARRREPAKRGSVIDGGVIALRNYRAAGAYTLQLMGPLLELVPFLVAHLLTQPGAVALKRCERRGCGHYVIAATGKRGRPQRFCTAGCREWAREQLEQQRKTRRRKS